MSLQTWLFRSIVSLGWGLVVQMSGISSTNAAVISSDPTLPILGVPFASSLGMQCFPTAGFCVSGGTIVLTSLVSSTFNVDGQDLLTDAVYTGQLTTALGTPVGPVTLSGIVEQEIEGRTFSTEQGSWSTDVLDFSLNGPLGGNTLTLDSDASKASTGTAAVVAVGGGSSEFLIDNTFDVFANLSLDSNPPLNAPVGPVHFAPETAPTVLPEPDGLSLIALPVFALAILGAISANRKRPSPDTIG